MPELLPSEQVNRAIPARPQILEFRLRHLASKLEECGPVRIVAIGSSSTAGEGKVTPYPPRLEAFLRSRFKDVPIDVLNRGIGGEEAPEELCRFERDVLSAKPDVVIWQVGTNAVFQARDLRLVEDKIWSGLQKLSSLPTDVILMDLQYAPAILTHDREANAVRMVAEIEQLARKAQVNVFHRFDLMQRWHRHERVSFDRIINPDDWDRLHQSDWSTDRIAYALFQVMVHALRA